MLPFTFQHPSNILLVGPTGAGKTQFLLKSLEIGSICPQPTRIVWIYAEWQAAYDAARELSARGLIAPVEFIKNVTDYEGVYESFSATKRNLLIVDDQMAESKSNAANFANIFTKGSHHKSITVVFLIQNLFEKGGAMRTVSLNSQYIAIFKNPRDKRQISTFAQQIEPANSAFIRDSYLDATRLPHSYLMFDLRQETPEELRLLSDVHSSTPRVYVPNQMTI